jgi:hypothetical protein
MHPHEFERRAVAQARGHLGRTDNVGEHDGPQPRVLPTTVSGHDLYSSIGPQPRQQT